MEETGPIQKAYEQGLAARKAKKPARTNPYKDPLAYGLSHAELRALHKAWKDGHRAGGRKAKRPVRNYAGAPEDDSALPEIETRPAVGVKTRDAPVRREIPGAVWPEDKPLPTSIPRRPRRPPFPCQECRRVLTKDGGQACYVRTSDATHAYCRCRACGGRFSIPLGAK